jgi:hypothetical protein
VILIFDVVAGSAKEFAEFFMLRDRRRSAGDLREVAGLCVAFEGVDETTS